MPYTKRKRGKMNKKELHEQHQLPFALILSLFFHIMLILYILKGYTPLTPFKPNNDLVKKPDETNTEWVETHAQSTGLVYFQQTNDEKNTHLDLHASAEHDTEQTTELQQQQPPSELEKIKEQQP